MAEFVFKQLAAQAGLSDCFEIDSAATSTEEIGNPIYPQALQCLRHHGIADARHSARQVTKADYDYFDQLILMENYNLRNLRRIIPSDPEGKVSLLLSHVAPNRLGAAPLTWPTLGTPATLRLPITTFSLAVKPCWTNMQMPDK